MSKPSRRPSREARKAQREKKKLLRKPCVSARLPRA